MNSKSEFHQPGIVRIVAVRGNVNDEQMGVFPLAGRGGGLEAGGGAATVAGGRRAEGEGPGQGDCKFGRSTFVFTFI